MSVVTGFRWGGPCDIAGRQSKMLLRIVETDVSDGIVAMLETRAMG